MVKKITNLDILFNRKSIRKFKSKKVSKKIIDQIIIAGQRAPTACRMEAYSFIIISDINKRSQIIEATVSHKSTRKFMHEAPLWIMICVDFERQLTFSRSLGIEADFAELSKFILGIIDASLAAENMVIAAEALGLGSCFVGSIWTEPKRVVDIINLPQNVFPFLLLCIGYPDETPVLRPRWPIKAVSHENEYQMPTKEMIIEHMGTRKNWETSFPYKLNEKIEEKIKKDLVKLGFII